MGLNALAAAFAITLVSVMSGMAEGSCTVQNNSGNKVSIVPVDVDVNVGIEVDVGVSVQLPPSQQHCYFQNPDSGHQMGPVTLTDGTLIIILNGAVSGTVDVYVGVVNLLGNLQLSVNIFISL